MDECLDEQFDTFEKQLRNRDVSTDRIKELMAKLRRMFNECGFKRISDCKAAILEDVLAKWRTGSMSKQTSNHYLRAMKQFWIWLIKTERAVKNPIAEIPVLNAQTDRRHDRRPLSAEELARVVLAAEVGKPIESIPGKDRAMMYVIAAWTGFRRGEIGSLKLGSFDFEAEPPTVTVEAMYSKRKRLDTIVLHETVIERLAVWLAEKKPSVKDVLFPVNGKVEGGVDRKTAKMMRKDLEAARLIWLAEADSEEEANARASSDFLLYENHAGKFADFHANRHTYITNLAKAGVSPKTAQTLARHSDVRLTMGVYTHSNFQEQAEAVAKLPKLWEYVRSRKMAQKGILCPTMAGREKRW